MNQITKTEIFKDYFYKIWMVGVTVFPWFVFISSLMPIIGVKLSFFFYDLLFDFVYLSFFAVFIGLIKIYFTDQKEFVLSNLKNFIFKNSKKVFWIGIISTLLINILMPLFGPRYIFDSFFTSLEIIFVFPVLIIFYYIGYFQAKKFKIKSEAPPQN